MQSNAIELCNRTILLFFKLVCNSLELMVINLPKYFVYIKVEYDHWVKVPQHVFHDNEIIIMLFR